MRALSFLLAAALVTGTLTGSSHAQGAPKVQKKEKPMVELDWLVRAEDLWTATPDDLEKKFGSRKFVWQDKDRTRARFNPDKFKLTLLETDVGETLVSFKNGKVSGVTFSVLNKGDNDIIGLERFNATTAKLKSIVGGVSGVSEEARKREEMVSKNAGGAVWRSKKAFYLAEWLFLPEKRESDGYFEYRSPAHAEYVRLRVLPPLIQLGVQGKQAKATATKNTLAANVKREGKSAVIQNVPMVDQGSKGYCAVASFERVLRLYGVDLDMHDLANLAETYGGTNPMKMKEAVFKVAQKLGMNTREPIFLRGKQYESLFKEYNKIARQKGMTEIDLKRGATWDQVDPETLKATRLKESDYAKFRQEVVTSINRGIPVMWALQLGLFWEDQLEDSYEANRFAVNKDTPGGDELSAEQEKEAAELRKKEMEDLRRNNPRPPDTMSGGHLRLIVGYDGEKNLIYYSDSWGPGHELKSMPLEQAYTCTLAMFIIAPQ